ncbi:hypothetical protein EMIHUDRAFT_216839 [Emiliania huxleyi CCMP1516]|uniref:TauD/TfdA-like domain-containing protein n=2 Tax=Emiliania huxleyi TaxID=2903 RepID=A0A0D3ICP2_EMIH1|nr:hypothetical protein EMIHUDRAFT_216839 [Emiliania huxleyi CCMP1516]EOD09027.1 hypothetical protein EMIHUDRAFT_216839 [Emiliania huxleyi CCMP1516]|eukprot:XP_005761456.1 hypothetical protein EMIHUDRAFT_216839 [Emiliania huxleyi CCMP1516]
MHSSTALVAVAVAATALLLLQRQRGLLPLHHRPLRPFGACVEASLPSLIRNGALLRRLWRQNGGLLVLRGLSLTPRGMLELSALFGEVEQELDDSKIDFRVGGLSSVMRIGNVRDETGRLISMHTISAPLPPGGSAQYRAAERQPAWHTDSLYRRRPPVGSALYCVTAPPSGGATCFADATTAFASLDEVTKERLRGLTCVCSMAHHDAKVKKRGSPDYPTLSEAQRRANPAQRVPLVLRHPQTGREALSGMNAGTCAVLPGGAELSRAEMDRCELEAVEMPSVEAELRALLPFATRDEFVVQWQWEPGDFVVWDNRCTMHCATGFEWQRFTREMWRTTLVREWEE